jgi:hypothetical protein
MASGARIREAMVSRLAAMTRDGASAKRMKMEAKETAAIPVASPR